MTSAADAPHIPVLLDEVIAALDPQPGYVLVDGNRLPRWEYPSEPVVKGDDRVPAIAAASILAKVHRDRLCDELHQAHPPLGLHPVHVAGPALGGRRQGEPRGDLGLEGGEVVVAHHLLYV